MAKRLIGLLLAASIAGCSRGGSVERRFVRFYSDVVEAQRAALDSAAAVDSALAVAQRHKMSPAELALFRDRMRAHPERWADIWERVVERLEKPHAP